MFPSSDRDHVERAKGFRDGLNKMDSLSADYDKTLPLFGTKIYINDIIVDKLFWLVNNKYAVEKKTTIINFGILKQVNFVVMVCFRFQVLTKHIY